MDDPLSSAGRVPEAAAVAAADAVAAANKVYSDASEIAQDLTQLSHLSPSISIDQYQSKVTSLGIDQATTQLQQGFNALATALNASK